MTMLMYDGLDRYSAAADLDIAYTRGSTTFSTTGGINGGGSFGLNTFSSLTHTLSVIGSTDGVLSSGGTVHFAAWIKLGTFFAAGPFVLFRIGTNLQAASSGNAPAIAVSSDGSFTVYKHGDTTSVATSSTGLFTTGVYYHLEYSAKYAESPDGVIKLWLDRTQVINFTGDTLTSTQPSTITGWRAETNNNALTACDDPVLWDENGSDFVATQLSTYHQIEALNTSADSTPLQFTPLSSTNESNVDDAVFHDGDTTYNQSTTVGHVDTFAMTDQANTPVSCMCISVNTIAKKTDVGAVTMHNRIKHGSTTAEGSNKTLLTTYSKSSDYWGKNPDTSAAWGNTDVNGVEAGYEYQA